MLLSGLLVLCLTSCGSKPNVSTPSSSSVPPSQSSSIVPAPPSSELTPNMPESAVQSGKILALGAPEISGFPSDITVGTKKELDKWTDLIKSGKITSIAVNNMNDSEAELSTEAARSILKVLVDADLKLYDRLGNPMTGGAIHILAYDSSGVILFHSVYNGEWFSVAFEGEKTAHVFNGEGSLLDTLSGHIS